MHYIGLDVHKESVSYCVKTAAGEVVEEGRLEAKRTALASWAKAQAPWGGLMEATLFSGWIYDTLAPHAEDLAVGHPAAMEAITRAAALSPPPFEPPRGGIAKPLTHDGQLNRALTPIGQNRRPLRPRQHP